MVVISVKAIRLFILKNKEGKDAINNWYYIIQKMNCSNFHELKNIFNSVDAIGNDLYVFNIKGNNFRLITRIIFKTRTVFIKFIGSHNEYDKIDIKKL
jgi:mRNA interferase HigB